VKAILASALQDLTPAREQHQGHRRAFLERLTQASVDRAALEQLRRAELTLAESASTRIVQALADAAEVLTPEQRVELVRLAEQFRH
jgi:Spy/CpxP family protein refolding chaperone